MEIGPDPRFYALLKSQPLSSKIQATPKTVQFNSTVKRNQNCMPTILSSNDYLQENSFKRQHSRLYPPFFASSDKTHWAFSTKLLNLACVDKEPTSTNLPHLFPQNSLT